MSELASNYCIHVRYPHRCSTYYQACLVFSRVAIYVDSTPSYEGTKMINPIKSSARNL